MRKTERAREKISGGYTNKLESERKRKKETSPIWFCDTEFYFTSSIPFIQKQIKIYKLVSQRGTESEIY